MTISMSALMFVLCCASLATTTVNAQSGSKSKPAVPQFAPPAPQMQPATVPQQQPVAGSHSRAAVAPRLAMNGYCPVCIIEKKKWVRSNQQHQATYDGRIYYFPEEKQKNMFLADPAKYAPALGGDCIVCYAKMGARSPGSVQHGSLYQGRLFLFPDENMRAEFRGNPNPYVNADLAFGGNCAVCRVEMNQQMKGKPSIAAMHDGLRYLFPGEEQRNMFLANPQKYAQ